ncbi:MAG: hypothetical protein Q7K65_01025 [Candidatus Buchananbacteria bacterium]|nr:hypothetical protein [Candidatus Buchananbacteria bacterium]
MATALDKKVNFTMFFKAMGGRLQKLLASGLKPEEKLEQIIHVLTVQVQEKRQLAREIGAQMRAIADPETKELEALEALQARRAKLVKLGGSLIGQPNNASQMGQLSQEINGIDAQIKAEETTLETLKESYELAKANYQQALSALETVKGNGNAMLKAIEAHKQALSLRDKAQNQDEVDTSFMSELQGELSQVQAELRSDDDLEDDLDATNTFNVDAALARMDSASVDSSLMAEFQAATGK